MDIAKEILNAHPKLEDESPVHPAQKALAQQAYEVAPHEHALEQLLNPLRIPLQAKEDLWDAKRMAVNDPKLTKLHQIAAMDKVLLDVAETHPNVTKLLMEEKPEKASPAKPKAKKPAGKK